MYKEPEIDTLVELLQSAFPENERIKKGVIPLLSSKKAYIKILLDKWDARIVPALSAMETQQTCNDFSKTMPTMKQAFKCHMEILASTPTKSSSTLSLSRGQECREVMDWIPTVEDTSRSNLKEI